MLPENRNKRKKIGGSQQDPPCRLYGVPRDELRVTEGIRVTNATSTNCFYYVAQKGWRNCLHVIERSTTADGPARGVSTENKPVSMMLKMPCSYRQSNGTYELWEVRPFEINGPGQQSLREDYQVFTGPRKRTRASKET